MDGDLSAVFIAPENLLVMSSIELENRVEKLTSLRPLSPAELKEVKRQMRLVKNREYAQSSRIKKKLHTEELQEENAVLKDRVQQLEEENRQLKEMLNPTYSAPNPPSKAFVQDFSIYSNFLFESEPSSSDDMSPLFSSDSPLSTDSTDFKYDFKTSLSSSGSFATTFCMFMIVLSFGIFFSSFPGALPNFPLAQHQQQILPFTGASDQSIAFSRPSRSLLSHEDIDPGKLMEVVPNITELNTPQAYVRREVSYYEVLLEEANHKATN
jgi:hypothetical protein